MSTTYPAHPKHARPLVGRFAPSPTGALHLGSIYTAIASFCHIKAQGGKWLLRLEDTDFERCKASFSRQILQDLTNMGLYWDGSETYQSKRLAIYDEFIEQLPKLTYACDCSRKQLASFNDVIYPRLCTPSPSNGNSKTQNTASQANSSPKIRLQLPNTHWAFCDEIQGIIHQNPQQLIGDVVIKRSNAIINYIWAAAIDDSLQGVTHVVRGMDILPMTAAQLAICHALYLPMPIAFGHLPLIVNDTGQKLSKQNLASAIDTNSVDSCCQLWFDCLQLLQQNPPPSLKWASLDEIRQFAIAHWSNAPLQRAAQHLKIYNKAKK